MRLLIVLVAASAICLGQQKPFACTASTQTSEGAISAQAKVWKHGTAYQIAKGERYTVVANAEVGDHYLRVYLKVFNEQDAPETVSPEKICVVDTINPRTLTFVPAEQVAKRVGNQGALARFGEGFGRSTEMNAQERTTTSETTGRVSVTGDVNAQGTFTADSSTRVCDAGCQEGKKAIAAKYAAYAAQRTDTAQAIRDTAFLTHTLAGHTDVDGFAFFERPKRGVLQVAPERGKTYLYFIVVPVGDERFHFVFPVLP